jgi:N6-L-threonylcarbamoyladenine synthase
MIVLGVESSCDDTAAAVVADRTILSNVVASQNDIHARFGGIVPELASRSHIRSITAVIDRALRDAGIRLDDVDAVAATNGPGLVGSLLVGLCAAKAIALARSLPFVGVNHLEGHLLSATIENDIAFPFVALLVSGGHTSLYLAEDFGRYRLLGATRDDAAGEAYDKVAKMMQLGFPGGPVLDRLAQGGDPRAIAFPRARLKPRRRDAGAERFEFSFSGLKTAAWQYLRDHPLRDGKHAADVAASFQAAVVDMLMDTSAAAIDRVGASRFVVAGGVSANSEVRRRALALATERGIEVFIPSLRYCTDNAAMIAWAGARRLARGERDPLTTNAFADLAL